MCGRAYSTYSEDELRLRYANKRPIQIPVIQPNYNLSPSQNRLVLLCRSEEKQFDLFKWGLIPSWSKDAKIGYKLINARAETIHEKPSFRKAFRKQRCIVPLSGFIEWKKEEHLKRPFAFSLKDSPIMSIAGIWETWKPQDGEPIQSFSIITTAANPYMEKIHDRMPVILDPQDEEEWLDPNHEKVDELKRLLKPCPSEWLQSYEISTLINSPKNTSKEVLEPLKS